MRRILLGCALGVAAAGLACGGSGQASNAPVSVAGCIVAVDGGYMLTPSGTGASGPVGTAGREQKRYKLLDDANVGVGRYVGREARITGRVAETQSDGATVLRVSQMASGGECNSVK